MNLHIGLRAKISIFNKRLKMKKFVGIDISKETLDIYFEQEGKGQCQ
jgi:hypothetical protein